jgi:hypothetical protein
METGSNMSFNALGGGTPRTPGTPIAVGSAPGTGGSAPGEKVGSSEKVGDTKKTKGPTEKCRVCTRNFPVETWPSGSAGSRECKQALDNLGAAAKKQNQLEWWALTKENEIELQKVVAKCQEYCPQPPPGTGTRMSKRNTFAIVRYVEKFQSLSI